MYIYVHLLGYATAYPKGGHKRRRRKRKRRRRVSGSSDVAHTHRGDSSTSSSLAGMTSAGGGTPTPHAESAPGPSTTGGSTDASPANLIDLHTDTPSVPGESINGLMATLNLN